MSNIFIGFQIFHISKSLFSRTIPDTRSLYQSLPSQQSKQIRLLKLNIKGTIPTDSKKNNQGSAYETCDRACTLPQTTKTLKTHYITHKLHCENVFQTCGIWNVSIQKVLWSSYYKKVSKRKYFPLLHCLFYPSENNRFSFETRLKTSSKWL